MSATTVSMILDTINGEMTVGETLRTIGSCTLSTEQVAQWFVDRADSLGTAGADLAAEHPTWAPAAEPSMAINAIAGDIGPALLYTDADGFDARYGWWPLHLLYADEIVWRITCLGTLYVFRRLSDDGDWSASRHADVGDIHKIAFDALMAAGRPYDRDDVHDLARSIAWDMSHRPTNTTPVAVAAKAVAEWLAKAGTVGLRVGGEEGKTALGRLLRQPGVVYVSR